jgi:predicted MPP superfamily phosphohydrolase
MKKILLLPIFYLFTVWFVSAQRPALSDSNSFCMILLPDPQTYTKFNYNQPLFDLILEWINKETEQLNIKAVLCTGDLVEYNNYAVPSVNEDGQNGNQTSLEQWEYISSAFSRIDNRLPYITSLGNHDYGYRSAENRSTKFGNYFTSHRNKLIKKHLVSFLPNESGEATLENSAYEFNEPGWDNILIITSEFHPRDEVLSWAKNMASSDKFKDHTVIFMTHSYLAVGGERIKKEGYKVEKPNYGEDIWNKLIYPSSNIPLVICGHDARPGEKFEENVAFRTDKNISGKYVHQMMFNAQALGGGWHGNGGDGWLRILEFMPDGKTIKVKTFSPLFDISPRTKEYAWRKQAFDEFDILVE